MLMIEKHRTGMRPSVTLYPSFANHCLHRDNMADGVSTSNAGLASSVQGLERFSFFFFFFCNTHLSYYITECSRAWLRYSRGLTLLCTRTYLFTI